MHQSFDHYVGGLYVTNTREWTKYEGIVWLLFWYVS